MPPDVIRDVSTWEVRARETEGSGDNRWLEDPDGQWCLWKPNRIHEQHGDEQDEDWAELLAFRLARGLGIPAAVVHMAVRAYEDGPRNGSISYDLVSPVHKLLGWDMQNGFVLLQSNPHHWSHSWPGYGPRPKDRVGHTLAAVNRCLADAAPPIWAESAFDAQGTFAGYLLLDALIGNQDRHDANWGVIEDPSGGLSLAPSYDHGASLGFSLTDRGRHEVRDTPGRLESFARRGRATKFEGGKQRLVDLAHEALRTCGADVEQGWLGRLSDLTPDLIDDHVQAVPRMSEVARTFCRELLVTNRRRLLDVSD